MEQVEIDNVLSLVEKYGTGGSPKTKSFGTEIYGQIDLPLLKGFASVRRTEERFTQFDVDFNGKTVLDIGCHIGSLCFKAKEKGALHVVGIDTNQDRIHTARCIRDLHKIKNISFLDERESKARPTTRYQIVMCCSVDDYVFNKTEFYQYVFSRVAEGGVLIFESNIQIYSNHPFAAWCRLNKIEYHWLGEAIDKWPYGSHRARDLFKVYK